MIMPSCCGIDGKAETYRKKLSNLPNVTNAVKSRPRITTQEVLIESPCS